jgi:hypothetical protein
MAQDPDKVTVGDLASDRRAMTAKAPPSPTTADIRSQIEQTRAEMSQTIDDIQARLSPSRLLTNAKQRVRDATVGRVERIPDRSNSDLGNGRRFGTERVMSTVKANPIPVALVGVAATGLLLRTWRRRTPPDRSVHESEAPFREPRWTTSSHSTGFGNKRTLLVAACAGLAWWSAWRARQRSGQWPQQGSLTSSAEVTGAQFEPTTPHF